MYLLFFVAPICDPTTVNTNALDRSTTNIVYYQEQRIALSSFIYGGPFNQTYNPKNCCLKCTQTPGCKSWILEHDNANLAGEIYGCYLFKAFQETLTANVAYDSGNILPSWPHA